MGKIRDLAKILGKTQANNPDLSALLDSDDLPVTSTASSILALSSLDSLPGGGLTAGDTAYVSANNRFYVSNGSGWYNVALVNVTPSLTISPDGAVELNTDGTPTTITLTAQDSDNANLTFSVESDGSFLGLGTIAQDSSVFTITPFSSDSATQTSSTLTFKVTDGVGIGSGTTALSLTFKVANSNFTRYLLKADGGNDNQVDASTATHSITEVGNVTSLNWTPYHPGGYSATFVSTDNSITVPAATGSEYRFGSASFTFEVWLYSTNFTNAQNVFVQRAASSARGTVLSIATNGAATFYQGDTDTAGWEVQISCGTITANTWHHVAIVRNGSGSNNYTTYLDGTQVAQATWSGSVGDTQSVMYIGGGNTTVLSNNVEFRGYMRDFRYTESAVYTGNFTAPTNPLAVISDTKLLYFNGEPYVHTDKIDNADVYGDGTTIVSVFAERHGPYDYLGYSKSSHAGSVKFDGTGDYMTVAHSDDHTFSSGQFTIEVWVFMTAAEGTGFDTFLMKTDGTDQDWQLDYKNSATQLRFIPYVGGSADTSSAVATATLDLHRWHHIAVSRDGSNNLRLFHNGTLLKTSTFSSTIDSTNPAPLNIGARGPITGTYDRLFTGYMADLRIVKGTPVYTAAFTPPTAPLSAITNTTLLTCTNKNSIFDASGMANREGIGGLGALTYGKQIITKTGSPAASTTQRKFTDGHSIVFDGSNDNMSTYIPEAAGTRDFTIEAWVWSSVQGGRGVFQISGTSGGLTTTLPGSLGIGTQNNNWRFYASGGYPITGYVDTSTAIVVDTWHHVALVKTGGNSKLYLNGTEIGTIADTYDYTGKNLAIGCWRATSHRWTGYIQDLRITMGKARYTSNFTAPTKTFSA